MTVLHPEPPADEEAEQAVLGACLMNRDAIIEIASWLEPEDFFSPAHQHIYAAIHDCYQRRVPPDVRMVSAALRRADQFDQIGGIAYLSRLTDACVTSYHVVYYARIVQAMAVKRKCVTAGQHIIQAAYDPTRSADETLALAQREVQDVARQQPGAGLRPIGDTIDALEQGMAQGEQPGVLTGFRDLDEPLGGMQAGGFYTLGGRPSTGKSALVGDIVRNVANRGGAVAVFSVEMSDGEWTQRYLAAESRVPLNYIRHRRLNNEQARAVIAAGERLRELPIFFDDAGFETIPLMKTKTLRLAHEQGGLALVVIDYLQLVRAPGRGRSRYDEVSEVSRQLKEFAKECHVPLLVVAQLSRAVEGRTSHVPMLSDLKESGQIEQDSDAVLLLYREEMYDMHTDKKGIAEVHVAKNRHGPLGIAALRFDAPTMRFLDLSYRQDG